MYLGSRTLSGQVLGCIITLSLWLSIQLDSVTQGLPTGLACIVTSVTLSPTMPLPNRSKQSRHRRSGQTGELLKFGPYLVPAVQSLTESLKENSITGADKLSP
jgi:hypothetical protein